MYKGLAVGISGTHPLRACCDLSSPLPRARLTEWKGVLTTVIKPNKSSVQVMAVVFFRGYLCR